MRTSEIRIRFQEPSATLLEVVTGANDDLTARIVQAVEALALRPHHPYLDAVGDRLITRFKVTGQDGRPLTSQRATELLRTLRSLVSADGPLSYPPGSAANSRGRPLPAAA